VSRAADEPRLAAGAQSISVSLAIKDTSRGTSWVTSSRVADLAPAVHLNPLVAQTSASRSEHSIVLAELVVT
jgi:hypothetical protein